MALDRKFTLEIQGSECLGTSLHTKINPGFENLDTAAQLLSTDLATLSATVFSLSGETNSLIDTINQNDATTLSLLTGLSSYTVSRASKAWIKFDGTTITVAPCVAVFTSFNVLSVQRVSTGQYKIEFEEYFADDNYVITTSAGTSGINTYTLNPTPSTVEVYGQTFTTQPTASDSIISVIINSY